MSRARKYVWLAIALCAIMSGLGSCRGKSYHVESAQSPTNEASHDGRRFSKVHRVSNATDFAGVGTVEPMEGLPERRLKREGYVVSYNSETKCPNWVAWRLIGEHTKGAVGRMGNAFHEDDDVPEPRAGNADYKASGYSRGHMCPAGDNKWNRNAMYQTFLFSNICPQNANLNSGVWNQIEISCRRWAQRYGEVYIITGPMYFRSRELQFIGRNKVAVPDAFFKVVLSLNPPRAIGFVCRNTDGLEHKDLYVNTLSDVERLTGYHFFPDLDPAIRQAIQDSARIEQW